jgi:hypothetical protein
MTAAGYDLFDAMHALLLALLVQEPIQLLDAAVPQARLAFDIRDPDGQPLPARLTFRGAGGIAANLFTRVEAAPDELAVRKNVVYSLRGSGVITVPTGSFQVFATHGLEWSLAEQRFEFEAGKDYRFEAVLRQEIDSKGWISGDFHLHTLTHSGHGDSNLKERVISLVGEGVEFAVATDHNHNTSYAPEVEALKLDGKLAHITGNEVTTPIGHLNAFPLDAKRPPVRADLRDSTELFRIIRSSRSTGSGRPDSTRSAAPALRRTGPTLLMPSRSSTPTVRGGTSMRRRCRIRAPACIPRWSTGSTCSTAGIATQPSATPTATPFTTNSPGSRAISCSWVSIACRMSARRM